MKFATSTFAALATMATFALAAPGPVVADVGAANGKPADKRTDCGHNYCGECNGTGCKMGSGITYPCDKGSCTVQSGAGDGTPCGYDDDIITDSTTIFCPVN